MDSNINQSNNLSQDYLKRINLIIISSRINSNEINKNQVKYITQENEKFTIDIFFVRKNTNIRFLIERWELKLSQDKTKKIKKNYSFKKLCTFMRSIQTYTRILPAFRFFSSIGFNYELEIKIDSNVEMDGIKNYVENNCELSNGRINLKIQYLNFREIYNIEEQTKIKNFQFYSSIQQHNRSNSFNQQMTNKSNINLVITENRKLSSNESISTNIEKEAKTFYNLLEIDLENHKRELVCLNQKGKFIECDYKSKEENESLSLIFEENDDNYINISDDSFCLEIDKGSIEQNDIFLKFENLREILKTLPDIRFNYFKIYKDCINN